MTWNNKEYLVTTISLISAAAITNKLCLAACTSKVTGAPVHVVCVYNESEDGKSFELVPVAKLFDGNPYDEVSAPDLERDGT